MSSLCVSSIVPCLHFMATFIDSRKWWWQAPWRRTEPRDTCQERCWRDTVPGDTQQVDGYNITVQRPKEKQFKKQNFWELDKNSNKVSTALRKRLDLWSIIQIINREYNIISMDSNLRSVALSSTPHFCSMFDAYIAYRWVTPRRHRAGEELHQEPVSDQWFHYTLKLIIHLRLHL